MGTEHANVRLVVAQCTKALLSVSDNNALVHRATVFYGTAVSVVSNQHGCDILTDIFFFVFPIHTQTHMRTQALHIFCCNCASYVRIN